MNFFKLFGIAVLLITTPAFADDVILKNGESILVNGNRISCEGRPAYSYWSCSLLTAVDGRMIRARGTGQTKNRAHEDTINDCLRQTPSTFACTMVKVNCQQIED